MSANSNLPLATFAKMPFPFVTRNFKVSTRIHEHEFPRMPGAKVEKMGRKVYVFTFDCPFHATSERYPDLYPGTWNAFRKLAEGQTTSPLFVPELGTISALLDDFDSTRKGIIVSGEDVKLHFIEDDERPFDAVAVSSTKSDFDSKTATVRYLYDRLSDDAKAKIEKDSKPRTSLFGALGELTDAISAIKDQSTLYGNLLSSKLDKLTSLCHTIEATVAFVRKPENANLARSVRALGDASQRLLGDLHQTGRKQRIYSVPQQMTLSDLSKATYGDATHGGELLSLNRANITDPFRIRAGTPINYYAVT